MGCPPATRKGGSPQVGRLDGWPPRSHGADRTPPTGRLTVNLGFCSAVHQVHGQVREEFGDLDDDGLNWVPIARANSIAIIMTHLVGSEAETLRCVAGISRERDRDAEFSHQAKDKADVLAVPDDADGLLTDVTPLIDQARLETMLSLPTRPADEEGSGLTWLVGSYGHAREHVGQIQMTKQLYLANTCGEES
jgi:hypothetical protein